MPRVPARVGRNAAPVPGRTNRARSEEVSPPVKVEIWSDVMCPWCFIGKRRFEAALAQFEHADEVEVHWRSFELDPGAVSADATDGPDEYARRLAEKYGQGLDAARQMVATMTEAGATDGLDLRFDLAVRANTFDAHQVIHLAGLRGVQDAVKERLLLAYFTQGRAVGDHAVLVDLAVEAGLDRTEVDAVLRSQEHAGAVRAQEQEARDLGITGVPFFVVDRKYGVSGAQPPQALLGVLRQAWSERRPAALVPAGSAAADACGPDGCAV